MIKDVFVLKKNSWHTKLMKRIWNWDYYDFSNMCPYFWLTVLNVLISPFIILYDVAILIAKKISDFVSPYLDKLADAYEKRCNEKRERWYDNYLDKLDKILFKEEISENEFKLIDKIKNADYDKNREFYRLYQYKLDSEKRQRLRDIYYAKEAELLAKKREIEDKQYELKIVKERTNRKKIAEVLPVVKMIVKGLGIVAILFVAFFLYKVILIVIGWNWLDFFIKLGKYSLGALIIGVVLAVLWFTFKLLIRVIVKLWCVFGKYCVPCEENRDKIGEGFVAVVNAFAYPFIKIRDGVVFLWELLVALKRNNCPGIDWED